jgi:hypothetical protein
MNEFQPDQILKNIEIYEYYDGPISRLVLFSSGKIALIESLSLGQQIEREDLVIILEQDDLIKLKKELPLMKSFVLEIAKKNPIFIYRYSKDNVIVLPIEKNEILPLLTDVFSDDYYFEDTSRIWEEYC